MKSGILVCAGLAGVAVFAAGGVMAGDAKGAESIALDGGSRGSVIFPHGRHQGVLVDCKPCHDLFPREAQAVGSMKAAGKLQVKEVMNMCKNCHKDMAQKGLQTGPVACGDCHKK
ncbi:MAG TPA: cytochrome c3 family protein [Deferrisomatales bacterium]|nr:cytochrome c3 family protein [Deferrisomatales bacterium]